MKNRTLFILFSLGIFTLFLTSVIQSNEVIGNVEEIKYFSKGISIKLNNYENEFLIFETRILNLNKGERVEIKYSEQEYKNKQQIIIERIIKMT